MCGIDGLPSCTCVYLCDSEIEALRAWKMEFYRLRGDVDQPNALRGASFLSLRPKLLMLSGLFDLTYITVWQPT